MPIAQRVMSVVGCGSAECPRKLVSREQKPWWTGPVRDPFAESGKHFSLDLSAKGYLTSPPRISEPLSSVPSKSLSRRVPVADGNDCRRRPRSKARIGFPLNAKETGCGWGSRRRWHCPSGCRRNQRRTTDYRFESLCPWSWPPAFHSKAESGARCVCKRTGAPRVCVRGTLGSSKRKKMRQWRYGGQWGKTFLSCNHSPTSQLRQKKPSTLPPAFSFHKVMP